MMPQSVVSIVLFAVWVVAMLAFWNLHRHADFLSRKGVTILLFTLSFLLFFAIWFFERQRELEIGGGRVAIYPFYEISRAGEKFSARSFAIPELAIDRLQGAEQQRYRFVPLDWILEPADPDSLTSVPYLFDLSRKLHYPRFAVGVLHNRGDSTVCDFVLYDSDELIPLLEKKFSFATGDEHQAADSLSIAIASATGLTLEEPAVWSAEYSDAYFAARYELLSGNLMQAGQAARRIIDEDSLNIRAHEVLATVVFADPDLRGTDLRFREKTLRALSEKLARLSELDTTRVRINRLAAEGFLWREKFTLAEQYLRRCLRQRFWDSKALSLFTRLHYTRYRALGYSDIRDMFKKALLYNPGDVEAAIGLATAYLQANETDKAQAVLEHMYSISPNNVRLMHALGQVYVTRGMARELFDLYSRILEISPRDSDAFYNIGVYYYNKRDFKNARRFLKQAIAAGNHRNSRMYLASIAEQEGRLEEAVEYLRERIRLRSGEDDAYAEEARRHLFELMLAMGKVDSLGNVLEKKPGRPR